MNRTHKTLAAVLVGTTLAAGCHRKTAEVQKQSTPPPTPVVVAKIGLADMVKSVTVTGSIAALQDVQISAKAVGRVVSVAAREGDTVHKGQLLIAQDVTDLQANVMQAEANVQSAEAKVLQAHYNEQIEVTSAQQGIQQAKALVGAARQNYLKVLRGPRPQELLQSENSLVSAKANRDNALTTLNRNKLLFTEGAIAKADLDTAQTNYDVYQSQYRNAQESLSLSREGSRSEDIAAAKDQLAQQQTALQNAIANEKLVEVRRGDVVAANAAVAQAQATLDFNKQQVANAYIKSPIDGIVASRLTEPGQIASPGTALMRIVNVRTVYYQPTLTETDISQVHQGTAVDVSVDALPNTKYVGKVTAIYPTANAQDRGFTLRVAVDNPRNLLRPGMFARGEILTRVDKNAIVVPTTALVVDQTTQGLTVNTSSDAQITPGLALPKQHVIVVSPSNTAELREVQLGISNMDDTEITSGVRPGEKIVIVGQSNLKTGDQVKITNSRSAGLTHAASNRIALR